MQHDDNPAALMMMDKCTNLILALPIRPQLKTAHCVEILAYTAKELMLDKPELAELMGFHEGDTVFSVPARFMQWMDEQAREKGLGEMDDTHDNALLEAAKEMRAV